MNDGRKRLVSEVVLDSSVILALLKDEPVLPSTLNKLEGAVISAVNLCEILSKQIEFGMSGSPYADHLLGLLDRIEPFTPAQAYAASGLWPITRHKGLSFGDRACLALGIQLNADVYTADQAWAEVSVGVRVHLIR